MNFGVIPTGKKGAKKMSRVNWELIKGLSVKSMCRGSLLRGRQFVGVAIIISTLPRARIIVHKISKIMNNCNRILNVRSPLDGRVECESGARAFPSSRGGRTPVCTVSDFKNECNNVKHTSDKRGASEGISRDIDR